MKVRILNNTIRFRISQKDLAELSTGQHVVSTLPFPSLPLASKIVVTNNENEIDFDGKEILLSINSSDIYDLANSSRIGFSFKSHEINVLLEKDFKCLTDRGEDESELYENPRTQH